MVVLARIAAVCTPLVYAFGRVMRARRLDASIAQTVVEYKSPEVPLHCGGSRSHL